MTTSSLQAALDHAQSNRDGILNHYFDLLRIPSISADPAYKDDVDRCADWLIAEMKRIGLNNCQKITGEGHPAVYGDWLEAGDDKPTVLVYAHYDVQPVDPLDLWTAPPFEPDIRDGKLYARGASDDKSGVWLNLKAIESILATDGTLPVNVKVFFEGEEEIGSPNMKPVIEANRDLLKSDVFLLCDGGFRKDDPQIMYALRGITAARVTVTGPDHDLHSGMYGGAVHNPIHLVGKIIGSFHDERGRIQIPGVYDDVRELDDAEREQMEDVWRKVGATIEAKAGTGHFWAEELGSFAKRTTALPTLDVNGVWGGYQGPGSKTVIPSKAGFNLTMRLVADQNPHEIAGALRDYILNFASDTLKVEVDIIESSWPYQMQFEGPAVEAVQRALERTTGKRALMTRSGGSVPIGGMFQQMLGIPMSGLGLAAGENIHSPDEFIYIDEFYMALDTAIHYYYVLAETMG